PVTLACRAWSRRGVSPLLSPGPLYGIRSGKPTRNRPHAGSVVRVKGPSHSMTTEIFSKRLRRTFFVADLKCYMCGSVVGSVESEQSLRAAPQTARPGLVRQAGQATPSAVATWRRRPSGAPGTGTTLRHRASTPEPDNPRAPGVAAGRAAPQTASRNRTDPARYSRLE